MAKTIGIVSIKGGVGKTSTTSNLGASLASLGKKVLVVDANFSAPNLALHAGIINPEITIHHVLNDKIKIEDAIYETDFGFDAIAGAMVYSNEINPFLLRNKLNNVKKYYDFILIDSSPALNYETLASMVASDEIFVVTTPDYVTLATTLRAAKLAKEKKVPISGIILNKVYGEKFEYDLKDIEKATGINVVAVFGHDLAVLEALSNNLPLLAHSPKNPLVKEYLSLARAIAGEKTRRGFFSRLAHFFKSPPKQEINRNLLAEKSENFKVDL